MKFLILLSILSFTVSAETKLLLIGGGKRPVEAMQKFSQLAGGEKAYIIVVPWASETTEGADNIRNELLIHANSTVVIAPLKSQSLNSMLDKATGIFFAGGDQNKLMSLINEQSLKNVFKRKFEEGVVFAGTSAGTAIMSKRMLTGEGELTVLDGTRIMRAEGLGLLPQSVIVDQHFIVRSRFNRLAGAVLSSQETGLAIDESTSLLILNSRATVIGPTQVMTFLPKSPKRLIIDVYSNGDEFDL